MVKYIWIRGKRFYKYETYSTIDEAKKTAQYYKRKNKSRYFILTEEKGYLFPYIGYTLYFDKIIRFP